MTRICLFSILLIGCSSGGDPGPHSELRVTVGSSSPSTLASEIKSNSTSSRLMMQTSDDHFTVFVSLATPIQAQQIDLAADPQRASIWAKRDTGLPLIATSGTLTIESSENLLTFELAGVAKPSDATGASLLISGSITGVSVPK